MGKNQKGITLVALIITIIVMLILVAVTINVSLNGGLFTNARNAAKDTQREADKEELVSTMIGAYDKRGRFNTDLIGTLPNEAKWCRKGDETYENTPSGILPTGEGDYIITKNNNKFYIDSNGSVLDEKPENVFEKNGLISEYVKFGKKYTLSEDRTAYVIFDTDGSYTLLVPNLINDYSSPSEISNGFESGQFKIIDDNILIVFEDDECTAFYFDYDENNEKFIVAVYNNDNIENAQELNDENLKSAIIDENNSLGTFEYTKTYNFAFKDKSSFDWSAIPQAANDWYYGAFEDSQGKMHAIRIAHFNEGNMGALVYYPDIDAQTAAYIYAYYPQELLELLGNTPEGANQWNITNDGGNTTTPTTPPPVVENIRILTQDEQEDLFDDLGLSNYYILSSSQLNAISTITAAN